MYDYAPHTTARGSLPNGDAGVTKTLGMMRELAREGSRDPEVRHQALWAVGAIAGHDHAGEARALFRYVRDNVTFRRDINGAETLQQPRYTLSIGAGDCDDKATLLAAMLGAIGIDSSFKVVAADRSSPRRFSHVYVLARLPNGATLALDPTYSNAQAGHEIENTRAAVVPALSYHNGMGLSPAVSKFPEPGTFDPSGPASPTLNTPIPEPDDTGARAQINWVVIGLAVLGAFLILRRK